MERSKRILRQWKKAFGDEISEAHLQSLPESLAGAVGPAQESLITLCRNLPDFLAKVDETYAQLDERVELAKRSLELSSAELFNANSQLKDMYLTLDAVLNSLGEGFLLLGQSGRCEGFFSRACENLLEIVPDGKTVFEILRVSEEKKQEFMDWFGLFFLGTLDGEDVAALGPKYYSHSQGRVIRLGFKPVPNSAGKVQHVLLIATDLTQEVLANKAAEEQKAHATMITRVLRNQERFSRFVEEFRRDIQVSSQELVSNPQPNSPVATAFKCRIHTLKGASGMFGLYGVEKALHSLEQEFLALQSCGEPVSPLQKQVDAIFAQFEKLLADNAEIFGDHGTGRKSKRQVMLGQLWDFKKQLTCLEGRVSNLAGEFERLFIARPLAEVLHPFDDMVSQLASRQKKEMLPLRVEGSSRIVPENYQELIDSLVHVFRNIVDHGIESPAEREALGKNRAGQIRVHAQETEESWMELYIEDDGRGIQEDKLRAKLEAMNITVNGREELLHSIFLPEVSTAREVSLTSGRGIGLSAVKEAAERIGGGINVRSVPGKGVTFLLRLPILSETPAGY